MTLTGCYTTAGAALAAEWMVVSVLGKIAVEMTGE